MTGSERFLMFTTAIAVPVALGVETLVRTLLAPPDFVQLRAVLRATLTPVAWGVCGAALLASVVGLVLAKRFYARADARFLDAADEPRRRRARMGVFLLVASVPQIPALLATFLFSFGAALTPVLVAAAISSAGVIAQARRVGG